MIISTIKLFGLAGLAAFLIYSGYLFYEKNNVISSFLLIISLAIYIVVSEIEFKRKRHEAPWLFEMYKGE